MSDSSDSDSDSGARFKCSSQQPKESNYIRGTERRSQLELKRSRSRSKGYDNNKNGRNDRNRDNDRKKLDDRRERFNNVRYDDRGKSRKSPIEFFRNTRRDNDDRRDRDNDDRRDRDRDNDDRRDRDRDIDDRRDRDRERDSRNKRSDRSRDERYSGNIRKQSDILPKNSTDDIRNRNTDSTRRKINETKSITEIKINAKESNSNDLLRSEKSKSISIKSSSGERDSKKLIPDSDTSLFVGPALPPGYKSNIETNNVKKIEEITKEKTKVIIENENLNNNRTIGPSIPTEILEKIKLGEPVDFEVVSSNDEDDDNIIGPMPSSSSSGTTKLTTKQLELEKRAIELKLAQLDKKMNATAGNGDEDIGREEWMIELPDIRKVADLGLGARQFRTKERPDFGDRTSWTDTPNDKSKKNIKKEKDLRDELNEEIERRAQLKRDQEQEEMIKYHKKKHKRDKSLLEVHEKKLKKEKKHKEDEPLTRRPFSRDTDLQVNRFDDAQKRAVVKKAQLLDTRFSSGNAKYL